MTVSGSCSSICFNPSIPCWAVNTLYPSKARERFSMVVIFSSSSMTNIFSLISSTALFFIVSKIGPRQKEAEQHAKLRSAPLLLAVPVVLLLCCRVSITDSDRNCLFFAVSHDGQVGLVIDL